MLCDIQPPEPNPYGSLVNVGYQVTSTNVGGIQKFALERGDDAGVQTTGLCSNTQWVRLARQSTSYLEVVLREHHRYPVLLLHQHNQRYFRRLLRRDYLHDIWTSNALPNSVGVLIYTIDSRSYERALGLS